METVAPDVVGMADYCKKGHMVYKAEPCPDEGYDEGMNAVRIILDLLGVTDGKYIHRP